MTVAKEPFTGESSKQAVKPLRREGRNAPAALYARVHFCLRKSHARPRVQQAPGLPCALSQRGREVDSKPRTQCAARSQPHIQFSSSAKADDPVLQSRQ